MGEISQSVRVNGVRINSLLDTGATENYISLKLAKKLRLLLYQKYVFVSIDGKKHEGRISYANVDILRRTGSIKVVVTDVLPQDGYDLILGQSFLQDNEVILDFKNDKMKYKNHQPKLRRVGRI